MRPVGGSRLLKQPAGLQDAWGRSPARAVQWSGPTELGGAGKESGIPRVPVCPVLEKMCLPEPNLSPSASCPDTSLPLLGGRIRDLGNSRHTQLPRSHVTTLQTSVVLTL